MNAGFGPLPRFRLSPLIDIVLALRRNGQSALQLPHVYKQVFVGGGSEPAAPLVCPSSMEPRAKLKTSPIGMVERPPATLSLCGRADNTLRRLTTAANAGDVKVATTTGSFEAAASAGGSASGAPEDRWREGCWRKGWCAFTAGEPGEARASAALACGWFQHAAAAADRVAPAVGFFVAYLT